MCVSQGTDNDVDEKENTSVSLTLSVLSSGKNRKSNSQEKKHCSHEATKWEGKKIETFSTDFYTLNYI